ncbi:uncharacterized protein SPPG_07596 [Spizellomyces punctatus DAOM BR117]|uniref:SF3 helicase domain-containing protein n=1 Tax=Spizellomyces punctatus (strain DAOM BR117) TaxID=645134 RepID=A0A0L0H8G0_SPIPD|nr:uncharacterized protein SPPG_07596 [Spizellomyces punctatus DAOM BR117]KNC97209.1 hypothetical protein SPPG_07596 [Spizellomyces punctatus DAOM BR117]|eukprot:XP_016605249.1 hypothetical protein SPPG_07596 [Spizellomyces punctatus DAOM BR117]
MSTDTSKTRGSGSTRRRDPDEDDSRQTKRVRQDKHVRRETQPEIKASPILGFENLEDIGNLDFDLETYGSSTFGGDDKQDNLKAPEENEAANESTLKAPEENKAANDTTLKVPEENKAANESTLKAPENQAPNMVKGNIPYVPRTTPPESLQEAAGKIGNKCREIFNNRHKKWEQNFKLCIVDFAERQWWGEFVHAGSKTHGKWYRFNKAVHSYQTITDEQFSRIAEELFQVTMEHYFNEDEDEAFTMIVKKSSRNVVQSMKTKLHIEDFLNHVKEKKRILCFDNGVFDFEMLKLRPGQQTDYCVDTRDYLGYALDEQYVKGEGWSELNEERFDYLMARFSTMVTSEKVREYLFDHLCMTLDANQPQKMVILLGEGANGKTVIIDLIMATFSVKAHSMQSSQLGKNIDSTRPNCELKGCDGKFTVCVDEVNKNEQWRGDTFKKLINGWVNARQVNDTTTGAFKMNALLLGAMNWLPIVYDHAHGVTRRFEVFPMLSEFCRTEEEANKKGGKDAKKFVGIQELEKRIVEYKDVFMSFLIRRLVEIRTGERSLQPVPDEVSEKTNEFTSQLDPLGRFVAKYVKWETGRRMYPDSFRRAYEAWVKQEKKYGENPYPRKEDIGDYLLKHHKDSFQVVKQRLKQVDSLDGKTTDNPTTLWEGLTLTEDGKKL